VGRVCRVTLMVPDRDTRVLSVKCDAGHECVLRASCVSCVSCLSCVSCVSGVSGVECDTRHECVLNVSCAS